LVFAPAAHRSCYVKLLPGVLLRLHVILLVDCTAPAGSPPSDFVKWLSRNVAADWASIGLPGSLDSSLVSQLI